MGEYSVKVKFPLLDTTVSEAAGYAYLIIHKQFIIQNLI